MNRHQGFNPLPLILGILLFLGGVGCFVYFLLSNINNITKDMKHFSAPGETVLNLEKEGNYTIFHEHKTLRNGRPFYSTGYINHLRIRVSQEGREIPLEPVQGRMNYNSMDGRSGWGLYNFKVEKPGEYTFFTYFEPPSSGEIPLSLAADFVPSLLFTIFAGIGIMLVSIGGGVLIPLLYYLRQKPQRIGQTPQPMQELITPSPDSEDTYRV